MPKKEKVQEMFDHIAPTYDKLNHVLSMNVDKLWRRHALKEIVDGSAQRILVSYSPRTHLPDLLLRS